MRPRLGVGAILLAVVLVGCLPASTGTGTRTDGPRLALKESSRDFGRISGSQPAEHHFPFSNTGNQTLEIRDVWPEPPRPGA